MIFHGIREEESNDSSSPKIWVESKIKEVLNNQLLGRS
jgi:hypothetical protein